MTRSGARNSDWLRLALSAVELVCGAALTVLPQHAVVGRVFGALLGLGGLIQVVLYSVRLRRGAMLKDSAR